MRHTAWVTHGDKGSGRECVGYLACKGPVTASIVVQLHSWVRLLLKVKVFSGRFWCGERGAVFGVMVLFIYECFV